MVIEKLGLVLIAMIWYGLGVAIGAGAIRIQTTYEKIIFYIMTCTLSCAMLSIYT